jgi:DNA-binding response OmpR family regulator
MAQIVIVEDSDDFRDALCDWLFEVGFDAVAVRNAQEAIDLLERHMCQCLVLLDLMLPDARGQELLEWIRSHPCHRDSPIIVVTAARVKRVPGSNALFAKPVDFDALLASIRSHIGPLPN